MYGVDVHTVLTCVRCWRVYGADVCVRCRRVYAADVCTLLTCVRCWRVYAADVCTLLTCVRCWRVYGADVFTLLTCVRCWRVYGVCYRDGRLRENDQLLAIHGYALDSSISHAQAIQALHAATGHVQLVVARGPSHPDYPTPYSTTPPGLSDGLLAPPPADDHDMVVSTLQHAMQLSLRSDGRPAIATNTSISHISLRY